MVDFTRLPASNKKAQLPVMLPCFLAANHKRVIWSVISENNGLVETKLVNIFYQGFENQQLKTHTDLRG